ncbi:MAG TPA: DUF4340 domain-containing protein, partial [bacterium]|nr:DUF4340 domain-containing protein [bacterium]
IARRLVPQAVLFRPLPLWSAAFDPAAVSGVDDTCGPTPQRAERSGGRWTFRTPAGFPVDEIAMEGLTDAVAHAKAMAWISENDDGSFGFHGPGSCALTVAVGDAGDGQRVGVEFGMPGEGGVYARVVGVGTRPVAILPSTLLDLASHPAIDGSRLKVETESLDVIVVGRGASTVKLSRSGGVLVRSPPADPESGPAVRLEGALAGLGALYAVHAGPAARDEGFDQPTLTIDETARAEGGAAAETLLTIGAATRTGAADAYYARVTGINATFAVSRRAADAIASSL